MSASRTARTCAGGRTLDSSPSAGGAAASPARAADLEGGGRFYAQLADCDPAAVAFEMPVELCFRRIHEGEGLINYFWKFRPAS